MASNLIVMASNLIAMASNLIAMASTLLLAMASTLLSMVSNLLVTSDGLQQPNGDGLQPGSFFKELFLLRPLSELVLFVHLCSLGASF